MENANAHENISPDINKFESTLNNLQQILDIENSEVQEKALKTFINSRLNELQTETLAQQAPLSLVGNRIEADFINPETDIKRNWLVDSLNLNDPEIYTYLLNSVSNFYKQWNKPNLRNIVGYSIIYALGDYFGNHIATSDTAKNNVEFYLNHTDINSTTINLEELKGKKIAVCAEKATVAHNYLKFLGADSRVIFSNNCRLDDSNDGHAYIIISSKNGDFIFDPTNSIITTNTENTVTAISPAIYKISNEDYTHLLKRDGEQVKVQHINQKEENGKLTTQTPEARIYG